MKTMYILDGFKRFNYILIPEGIVIGLLSGLVVSLFRFMVESAEHLHTAAFESGHTVVLLLFLTISLDIKYTDDFFMTVRFAGIRIFKIEPGQDIKKPKSDAESDKKAEKQAAEKLHADVEGSSLVFYGICKECSQNN